MKRSPSAVVEDAPTTFAALMEPESASAEAGDATQTTQPMDTKA